MTRGRGLLVVVLAAAACGGSPSGADTTSALPATTTAASPATTTTTTAPGPIEIPADRLLKWEAGTYVAPAYWTPVSFTVDEPGWWSMGVADIWIGLEYHEGGESTFDLDMAFLAHRPDTSPEATIAGILGREQAETVREATPTNVGGHAAITADLVVAESPLFGGTCAINPSPGNSRFPTNDSGIYLLTQVGGVATGPYGNSFGIRSCRAARIWAIDVGGDTILVIAATTSSDLFEDLIPYADALLDRIEFGDD